MLHRPSRHVNVSLRGIVEGDEPFLRAKVADLVAGHGARSQMAEALLRREAGERFDVASAGLNPTAVHPLTLQLLEEIGVDTSRLHVKSLGDFLGKTSVRWAIIVCPREEAECPSVFPFTTRTFHWNIDDPTVVQGSAELQLAKFRRVRDAIDARVKGWAQETHNPRARL